MMGYQPSSLAALEYRPSRQPINVLVPANPYLNSGKNSLRINI
jgi:hypothetical protein